MTQRMNYAAAAPGGMKALGSVHGYVSQSGLPATLIDLVYLRVSQINGCAYCIDMHGRDLLKAGVPVEKLLLVSAWDEAGSLFSDREKAALKWAEVVTRVGDTRVPDEAHVEARAAFTEKQLADLTIAVGLIGAYNRLAISFRAAPLAAAPAAAA
ncbi:MAG TPA: carboxymuconolactone decarboxylase family protein [Geminicoccaceae bacterium]|jgi:AhpD family alkylhydroperoxidase|nr:carboxymuconolactone decarboxylase family protein [Geminicoccaceae bacterium]